MSKPSRLTAIHSGIKRRCYSPTCKEYKNYGARGITVCKEWLDSERINVSWHNNPTKGFLNFKKWALENGYAENLSIDRIDCNKGYCPENCRWVTSKEQNNNRRNNINITYKGETKTLQLWCDSLGLNYDRVFQRLTRLHWSVERAFETSSEAT